MMDVYLWVMYVNYVNCWAFLNMCLLCSICTEQHFSSETDCLLGDPPYTLASNHRSAQCQQNRFGAVPVEAFQPGLHLFVFALAPCSQPFAKGDTMDPL